MKKTISSTFFVQLTVLTIVGAAIFFQNRYLTLLHTGISYINVSVSKDEEFDAFLSWIKERELSAARVSVSSDNVITLHLSDLNFNNKLLLLKGRLPKYGEYVSDIITDDPNQSGIMQRFLPLYNLKIYELYEPEQLNYSSSYAINLTSENELNVMKNDLALKGVSIQLNEMEHNNPFLVLLSSFPSTQVILVLIFICSSMMVMFVSLIQYAILQLKSINILISLGYNWLQVIRSVVFELFNAKIWLGTVGLLYIILSTFLFLSDVYRSFYIQIASIFLVLMTFLICTYFFLFSGVIIVYFFTRKNRLSLSLKGMRPHVIVQVVNCFVKFASALFFVMAIAFLVLLYRQFSTERKNMQSWVNAKDIYRVSINDVGQMSDLAIEVGLHTTITNLYKQLSTDNNAFFMDAEDIYAMEVYGENYPLTGLLTNGYYTHITVSPNYFHFNPIVTNEGIPVEQKLIFSDNVLNLLVPESQSSINEQLYDQFLDYFDFYRFRVFEEIYSDVPGDLWNPSKQEEPKINIIFVKNNQNYFTFSPNIRQNEGNKILDPVVVVYSGNFHPSSTFTKATRCLFFQYDNSQYVTPNDYLAEVVGMDDFVLASSIWNDVASRVSRLQRNYISTVFLSLFIVLGYLVTSFSLFSNYFARNRYSITIKAMWGYSIFRRYCTAFAMLFIPTLMALLLFIFIMVSPFARFLPSFSIQGVFIVGVFLIGIDALYFISMEQRLIKKSVNSILKGEVL